jgi:hypothetical protein
MSRNRRLPHGGSVTYTIDRRQRRGILAGAAVFAVGGGILVLANRPGSDNAVFGLVLIAVGVLLFPPYLLVKWNRVTVDETGIHSVLYLRHRSWSWAEVAEIEHRAVARPRFGVSSSVRVVTTSGRHHTLGAPLNGPTGADLDFTGKLDVIRRLHRAYASGSPGVTHR